MSEPTASAGVRAEGTPDSNRAFEPVTEERDELVTDITGVLPAELRGTLYRNAPARWEGGGFAARHAFDGDGMVSRFVLDGSSLHYRNRFVRTPKYLREAAGKGGKARGIGTQRRGGAFGNAFRLPADRANTHAVWHAERLLALSDDGRPWELDPDSLATLGACDFGGGLSRFSTFSPHPRVDPVSGELFNFGHSVVHRLRPGIPYGLKCYRVGTDGRLSIAAKLPLDNLHINHDFVITQRYLVFVLAPFFARPAAALRAGLGLTPLDQAFEYHPEQGTRILLVPRDGGPTRVVETEAVAYVHFNNAYDDGDDVVIDLIRYPDWDMFQLPLREFRTAPALPGGSLHRLCVTGGDRVLAEDLSALPGEFPMHDLRTTSLEHRYSYYFADSGNGTSGRGIEFGKATPSIVKVDNLTGDWTAHPFGPYDLPGEPVFVPRSAAAAEDDGWLLTVTYLAAEHRAALVIMDARDLEAEPVAVARLGHHAFPGFHGGFTTRLPAATG